MIDKPILPTTKKWLEENPGNNYPKPLVHIGTLNSDLLNTLADTAKAIPYQDYHGYSKFTTTGDPPLCSVGIYTENGDPNNYYHHYTPDGEWIDPHNKRIDLRGLMKSVRNSPPAIDTKYMTPVLKALITQFPGLKKAWIARLSANGGTIPPHSDTIPQERMRVHVSLTAPDTDYYVGEHHVKMALGGVYWLNTHLTHAVINNTAEDRFNICIDCFWPTPNVEDFCAAARTALTNSGTI